VSGAVPLSGWSCGEEPSTVASAVVPPDKDPGAEVAVRSGHFEPATGLAEVLGEVPTFAREAPSQGSLGASRIRSPRLLDILVCSPLEQQGDIGCLWPFPLSDCWPRWVFPAPVIGHFTPVTV
jgi:hypothetical protein